MELHTLHAYKQLYTVTCFIGSLCTDLARLVKQLQLQLRSNVKPITFKRSRDQLLHNFFLHCRRETDAARFDAREQKNEKMFSEVLPKSHWRQLFLTTTTRHLILQNKPNGKHSCFRVQLPRVRFPAFPKHFQRKQLSMFLRSISSAA